MDLLSPHTMILQKLPTVDYRILYTPSQYPTSTVSDQGTQLVANEVSNEHLMEFTHLAMFPIILNQLT